MDFPKQYDPQSFEASIADRDEKNGYYKPLPSRTGKTFYIPIPPPNVTGELHVGHAQFLTLQDIMIRYHRMKWDETLWVPGTDHAGIATQARVEKRLESQWKSRLWIGREAFLEESWKWMEEFSSTIRSQIRRMGASVDWDTERFTFDQKSNNLVEKIFVDLYKKGIIYRGDYMINYSPGIQSVISDIEVDYKEEETSMYYITYFVSWSDNELTIATTRPETLLADQAVAVHPKDKRFKKLIGRKVILPIVNKEIPIIADEMVDMNFGTGAVKITPAHDATDFETGKRHNLRLDYAVIDKNGKMNEEAWIFASQDAATTARENIVELLKAKGNLLKTEPYTHKVWYCSRSGKKIETIVSTQWFVRASELAKKVITGYEKKEFVIIPSRFNKMFEDWIYNLKDWCISRQLWWGHQIPAYYDVKTGELLEVTRDEELVYKKYGKENVRRDEDVLDTWFSSGIWPFSILEWDFENPSEMFQKFYPANVLETGYDILTFWVIRMLLFGYEYTNQTPFKTVYLHGLVFDAKGKKMSKSWGNVIDPIVVINEYSVDALRLTLWLGGTPGNNFNYSLEDTKQNSVLLNKLWNIGRFIGMNIGEITEEYDVLWKTIASQKKDLLPHEAWILSRLRAITDRMTEGMETYNFSERWQEFITFLRDEFADFAVEEYKLTKETSKLGRDVMAFSMLTIIKLFHPYVPFITEELYRILTGGKILITSEWPVVPFDRDLKLEEEMEMLYKVIREIRNIRANKGVKPGDTVEAIFATPTSKALLESNQSILCWLAKLSSFTVMLSSIENSEQYSYGIVGDIEIYLNTHVLVDTEAEKERIKKEIADKKEYIRIIDTKLTNQDFVRNAPEKIVRIEQDKKYQALEQLQKLTEKYEKLEV